MTTPTRGAPGRGRWRRAGALLVLLATCGASALAATPAHAQMIRIAYIDSQRIFEQYADAVQAQSRFEKEIQAWKSEADDRHRQLDALRNELKDQQAMLSEAKRVEK